MERGGASREGSMGRSGSFTILACAGLLLSGLALAKGPGMTCGAVFKFGPDLYASGWRYMSFPDRQGAEFRARGEDTVIVQAEAGVGVLWHSVPRRVSAA